MNDDAEICFPLRYQPLLLFAQNACIDVEVEDVFVADGMIVISYQVMR